MLTSSTQLQNRSFHVVEGTRTSSKCQKMKNARAKRAKILFFIVKYANLWGFCCRLCRGCLSSLLWSQRSTTRERRKRQTFGISKEQKQKHFFPVLGKSAAWNDHFSSFTENVNKQRIWIFFLTLAPHLYIPFLGSSGSFQKLPNWHNDENDRHNDGLAILRDVFASVAS